MTPLRTPPAQIHTTADPDEPGLPSPCGRPLLYAAPHLGIYHALEQPKPGEFHSHEDIQIALPLGGVFHATWQTTGGRECHEVMPPGTLSLSASRQPHTIQVAHETELAVIWVPSTVLVRTAEELGSARTEIRDSGSTKDPLLLQLCLALLAEVRHNPTPAPLYVDAMANLLTAHLIRRHSVRQGTTEEARGGLSPRRLKRTLAYIHENLDRDISLAGLAGVTGLSPSHFAPLFRLSTGFAPYQYVMHQRIERAKTLLSGGSVSVGEIAQQVGFCDQSQFARQFKQHVGLTPQAYRKATL
jgi:AraC family transcriptional regulator